MRRVLRIKPMLRNRWILLGLVSMVALASMGAANGPTSAQHESLSDAAADLMTRITTYSRQHPGAPGSVAPWMTASIGHPLLIEGYPDPEPVHALVPVIDTAGRWIGGVGVDVASGRWLWYAETEAPRSPPPAIEDVLATLARRGYTPTSIPRPRLIIAPDRQLCWLLSCEDSGGGSREILVDLWNPSRVLAAGDLARLSRSPGVPPPLADTPPPPARLIDVGPTIEAEATEGTDWDLLSYPPEFDLDVPHYYQETWFNCGPASLEMMLDYWGEHIDQETIAYVGNTSPIHGTHPFDLRRAVHFSHLSQAVANPYIEGYPERSLGYAAAENRWSHQPDYDNRYDDLKRLVASGYPVLMLSWFSPSHTVGHYRIVKGYSDPLGIFIVHDPWYAGPYGGPNVHYEQEFLVDNLWRYGLWGRWALFTCPWGVTITAPDSAKALDEFVVRAEVIYPGPHPFAGEDSVQSAQATLDLGAGMVLAAGELATKPLPHITTTGTVDTVAWRVVARRGVEGPRILDVTASGLVTSTAESYREYTDEIGTRASDTIYIKLAAAVMLVSFEARCEPGIVHFAWSTHCEVDLVDMRLCGRCGDEEWDVPIEMVSPTEFAACDQSEILIPGGCFTYALHFRRDPRYWELLHSEEILLDPVITMTTLMRTYPNPTREDLSVSFRVHRPQQVRIALYDTGGRLIARLADRPYDIGVHSVSWDGRNSEGRTAPAGTYFLRLDSESARTTRKIIRLR